MKLLSLVVVFVAALSATQAWVQNGPTTCHATSGDIVCAVAGVSSGNTLHVGLGYRLNSATAPTSVGASIGTAALISSSANASTGAWLYCIALGSSGTETITVTMNGTYFFGNVVIQEFSGSTCTASGTAAQSGNDVNPTCGAFSPTTANTIVTGFVYHNNSAGDLGAGTGYSTNAVILNNGGTTRSAGLEYKIVAAIASQNPSFTTANAAAFSCAAAAMQSSTTAVDCAGDTDCYTLVYVPDAQFVHNYSALATYITSRKAGWNIKGVISGGDVVNDGTGSYSAPVTAYKALTTAGIPWFVPPGNHDYCNCTTGPNNITTRTLPGTVWNNGNSGDAGLFAPDHRADTYWAYGTDAANVIYELTISASRRLLIVALEFFPRSAVLDWAQTIVQAHPSHEVVLTTHAYLTDVGELYADATPWSLSTYGLSGPPSANQAVQMWAGWLANWPNLRMVWSGHYIAASWHDPGSGGLSASPYYWNGRLTNNATGKTVQQFFNNYQDIDGGTVQIPASGFTTADFDHVTFIKFPSAGGYQLYDWATTTGVADGTEPMYTGAYEHVLYGAGGSTIAGIAVIGGKR